ncbi:hypothetical protein Q7P35_008753 [Cladosporium inversicolor]
MLKSQDETEVSDSAFARWQDSHSRTRIKQLTKGALLALISVGVSLITFRYLCVPLLEYTYPESRKFLLDSGIYGAYPSKKYVSTNLASPQANVVQTDDSCADDLVLLSVGGQSVTDGGPMILDMSGNLVWSAPGQYGDASANTKIQRYYMLNSSYDIIHRVSAVDESMEGDLHEFKITKDGSALIIVYDRLLVDLKNTNVDLNADQMIIDGILQKIDIATGKLVFEWRSSDHLDHPALQTSSGGFVADGSFDYFHMNSIEKDTRGNYLISFRHLHTLVYVEDFEDLSQGDATGFQWQHDARWISESDGIISLFDNGIAHKHPDAAYIQGLVIQLDLVNWTATLLQKYISRDLIGSASQAFTEHDIGGELLCETHFGASWLFYFERVRSYRAFKTFDWKAIPSGWDPEARIANDEIYVSWNGATEVAY